MDFEQTQRLIAPLNQEGSAEDVIETQIGNELETLRKNVDDLRKDAEDVQSQVVENDLDEERKKKLFNNAKKIAYAAAAMAGAPLLLSVLKPEKAQEINRTIEKFVNNPTHIAEIFGVIALISAIPIYEMIKYGIKEKNQINSCHESLDLAITAIEKQNWALTINKLEKFSEVVEQLIASGHWNNKKMFNSFEEKLAVIESSLQSASNEPDKAVIKSLDKIKKIMKKRIDI